MTTTSTMSPEELEIWQAQRRKMGFSLSHGILGCFLFLIAIWWIVNIFKRYYMSPMSVVLSPFFPGPYCQFPVESLVKLAIAVAVVIASVIEQFQFSDLVGVHDHQHMSIAVSFGLLGYVELLRHWRFDMPQGVERLTFLLFVTTAFVSMAFHDFSDTPFRHWLHVLLKYLLFGLGLASLLELQNSNSVVLALARSYMLLLASTWLGQIAVYFQDSAAWEKQLTQFEFVFVLYFMRHMIVDFVVIMVIGAFVKMSVEIGHESTSRDNIPYTPVISDECTKGGEKPLQCATCKSNYFERSFV